MMRTVLVTVSVLMMVGCGTPVPATRAERIAALTGSASAGKTLFDTTCASCHGTDGKGITGSGVDLVEPAKNDPATEVIEVILNGKSGTTMVAYGTYSDQQIADLYAHLKTNIGK